MTTGTDEGWYEAPAFRIRRRADGILEARAKVGAESTVDSACASLAVMKELIGSAAPVPMLADLRDVKSIAPEVGSFVASVEVAPLLERLALVVGSPVSEILATGFLGLQQPPTPTRIFHDTEAALAWLRDGDEHQSE